MIKIIKKDNLISIGGHAEYDDIGKDIVCSAVSTLTLSNIELLKKFDLLKESYYENGKLYIEYIENDISNKIIDNTLEMLEQLNIQYPKNVDKIEYRS